MVLMGFLEDAVQFGAQNIAGVIPVQAAKLIPGLVGGGGGGQSSSSGSSSGEGFHADDMIRSVYGGLNDQQVKFIRDTLARGGITEKSTSADFRKALQALGSQIPGLGQMSQQAQLFPQSQPGQMSPQMLQGLLKQTQAYQKPFLDELQSGMSAAANQLRSLLPSLPKSYQNLVNMEIPTYESLGKNLANVIYANDPGQIQAAYASQNYAPAASAASSPTAMLNLLKQGMST